MSSAGKRVKIVVDFLGGFRFFIIGNKNKNLNWNQNLKKYIIDNFQKKLFNWNFPVFGYNEVSKINEETYLFLP